MAAMRVALVNRLAGIHRGGGEIYDLCLARALREAGIEIEMITARPLLSAAPRPVDSVPAVYARTPYLRAAAHSLGRAGWRLLDLDLRLFERAVFDLLAASRPRPDLVQVTGLPRLARRLEAELALTTLLLFPGPPSLTHLDRIRACRHVAGVGAVTPYLREHFRIDVHDMTAGVDATLFRPGPSDLRRDLRIPEEAPLLLFAGRLVPLKNLPLLVEAFVELRRSIPSARLLVVGDGPMLADLLRRGRRAGLLTGGGGAALLHAGDVPHASMPRYYAVADLLLLTSLNESFSLVALEAMACGRTTLVPAAGYLPTLIDDGVTGVLYPPGDRRTLVEKAASLLRDASTRERIGRAAREAALKRHSWGAVASEFVELYHRLLAS
jgi:glycosyltransferase involved in cell wall biosynthesis